MISVLIVDDEPGFLDIEERFLAKDGDIRVLKARSVKAALEWLNRETVDVIISDYEMPEINGIEFLIHLRKEGCNIPFIILTGKGWVHVATKAMDYGVDHYLRKGEDPKELFEHIRRKVRVIVQERAQRRIFEQQYQRYHTLFDQMPLACLVLNGSRTVIDANRSACAVLGYRPEEICGISYTRIFQTDSTGNFLISEKMTDSPHIYVGQPLPKVKTVSLARKDGTLVSGEIIAEVDIPGENLGTIIFREVP